jgi:hypothetical protein
MYMDLWEKCVLSDIICFSYIAIVYLEDVTWSTFSFNYEKKTVMVNNSTHINKTIHNLITSTEKDHDIWRIGNPGPGLGQVQKCGGVKSINIITTLYAFSYLFTCSIIIAK